MNDEYRAAARDQVDGDPGDVWQDPNGLDDLCDATAACQALDREGGSGALDLLVLGRPFRVHRCQEWWLLWFCVGVCDG